MRLLKLLLCSMLMMPAHASARDLTVATWNLGWHIDKAAASQWVAACNGLFEKDAATGTWKPTTAGSGIPGWQVNFREPVEWDWNAFPVCDVYQDRNFDAVPVTIASYDKRLDQLSDFFASKLSADIYAFQEVSGEQAVRDALPAGGTGYEICSFADFKVQRLAIAWRSEIGTQVDCRVEPTLALPGNPENDRPRPGLSLGLMIDGELVRFLAVHLKSSCVSPLEPRGDLAGNGRDCTILQQQLVPLEQWVEQQAQDTDKFVVLGDFNRNFWHEQHDSGPVRTDNSDPQGPLPSGAMVKDLFAEVFDGEPEATDVTLLHEVCAINSATTALCEKGETALLTTQERQLLSRSENLGCRNPLGLDHILITSGITASGPAEHVSVGVFGGTKPADATHPDPLLAISDHCPMVARLAF